MITRNRSLLLILGMVFITGVGVYLIRSPQELRQAEVEPVPVAVEVAGITPRDFTYRLEALGTVKAIREASVGTKVSGPVTLIPPGIELGARYPEAPIRQHVDGNDRAVFEFSGSESPFEVFQTVRQ